MKLKYLSSIIVISACLFATQSNAGENKSTTTTKQSQSSNSSHRDAASGLPTGKRQHKSIQTLHVIDKASPARTSQKAKKSAYRLCPDGTMINPGEKCPEKKKR